MLILNLKGIQIRSQFFGYRISVLCLGCDALNLWIKMYLKKIKSKGVNQVKIKYLFIISYIVVIL